MTLVLGRLALGNPIDWAEPTGDQVDVVGGLPVAGAMQGMKVPASALTISPVAQTVANNQALRRQLRSLLNNGQLRLSGIYVTWDVDPEQNGWYVPDGANLKNLENMRYPDFIQKLDALGLFLVGRLRTHRRGVEYIIACRAGMTAPRYASGRDYLGRVAFGEFTTITVPFTLAFTPANATDIALPPAASGFVSAVGGNFTQLDGSTTAPVILSTSQDGGIVHFEQVEADRLKGDVVIRDRRGTITNPGAGADPAWQEVYGADWVSSEADGRFTLDSPVIENGRCRVTYVAGTNDGFRVEVASGGAWVEQGIMVPARFTAATVPSTDLVLAQVMEWTPERGVLKVIMRSASDAASREECYITLQRGWSGPRFECYPAPSAAGVNQSSAWIWVTGSAVDTNDSATAIPTGGVATHIATATGAGPNAFTGLAITNPFTGENWVHLLRQAGSFCVTLSVVQAAALQALAVSQANVYGAAHNAVQITNSVGPPYPALGYSSVKLDFYAQLAQQIMEAEAMTLGAGTTVVTDAGSSGGATNNSTTAARAADAIHVQQATWPNGVFATYRIFARVRTTSGTMSLYAKTGATTGATKTTTSAAYVWIDLGEIVANNTLLEIHAWNPGAVAFWVDRIEAIKVQDRTATAPFYDGSRDVGFAHLLDVDPQVAVVPR